MIFLNMFNYTCGHEDMTTPPEKAAAEPAASTKAQRTRERIFGSAMDLFMSRGYEKTTMRMIADRAGVNVALSYYYFPSKEHLVFEFYRNFARDFIERSAEAVASSARLEARLTGVTETMFATADPYHAFAGSLFATAASPASPLNPFSADFTELRDQGVALFERVIDGCVPRVPEDLVAEMPFLLWTFSLAMLYCWMHDQSDQQEKTRLILGQSARLITGLIRLSGTPGSRYFRRQLLSISQVIRTNLPAPPMIPSKEQGYARANDPSGPD
jgi:AcrR family transcriptional regulator